MAELSENAKRILLFLYILAGNGLPPWEATDELDLQATVAMKLTGLGKAEVLAAMAELQDAKMADREG